MSRKGWYASDHLRYVTPQGVICDRLPDLHFGEKDQETTSGTSLKFYFTGDLSSWASFNEEVSEFYFSEKLQAAFDRTSKTYGGGDPEKSMEERRVASEGDMEGRFGDKVLGRVRRALRDLWEFESRRGIQMKDMPDLPPEFDFSSARGIPKHERQEKNLPDISVMVPPTGPNQQVRVIGELKFPITYSVADHWEDPESMRPKSFRNFIGQAARYMGEYGLRYALASTYDETVFLKVHIDPTSHRVSLHFSDIIKHTDIVGQNPGAELLESISVRFGVLFLLHKSMDPDPDMQKWSFDKNLINRDKWVFNRPSKKPIPLVAPHRSEKSNALQSKEAIRPPLSNLHSPDVIAGLGRGFANMSLTSTVPTRTGLQVKVASDSASKSAFSRSPYKTRSAGKAETAPDIRPDGPAAKSKFGPRQGNAPGE